MKTFRLVKNFMSCTVFVPWNCTYNCSFCNSKINYKSIPNNLEKVIEAVKKVTSSKYINELAITGGEPLSDLNKLKQIVDASQKRIYINTSFTKKDASNPEVIDYINNEKKILGLSISRHFQPRINEAPDKDLLLLKKPIKLNCYIGKSVCYKIPELTEKYKKYIDRFAFLKSQHPKIQFREDYRFTKPHNLKGLTTNGIKALYSDDRFRFYFSGGCLACSDDAFRDIETGMLIYYHRGLQTSSMQLLKNSPLVINDVIIYQNGEICYDWQDNDTILYPTLYERKVRKKFLEFLEHSDDKFYIANKWDSIQSDPRFFFK